MCIVGVLFVTGMHGKGTETGKRKIFVRHFYNLKDGITICDRIIKAKRFVDSNFEG